MRRRGGYRAGGRYNGSGGLALHPVADNLEAAAVRLRPWPTWRKFLKSNYLERGPQMRSRNRPVWQESRRFI